MDLSPHVQQLSERLAAAAPEDVQPAVQRLLASLEPAIQLQVMDVLCVAAMELSEQLPDGHVDLRLAGRDVQLHYVEDQARASSDPPAAADDGGSARVTLRLPETLKTAVESAADDAGVSTNSWLIQAIRQKLDVRTARRRSNTGNSFSGYASS